QRARVVALLARPQLLEAVRAGELEGTGEVAVAPGREPVGEGGDDVGVGLGPVCADIFRRRARLLEKRPGEWDQIDVQACLGRLRVRERQLDRASARPRRAARALGGTEHGLAITAGGGRLGPIALVVLAVTPARR